MTSKVRGNGLKVPVFRRQLTPESMVRWTAAVWLAAAARYVSARILTDQSAMSGLLLFVFSLFFFGILLLARYTKEEGQRQKRVFENKISGLSAMQLDALAKCKPCASSHNNELAALCTIAALLMAWWVTRELCDWADLEAGLRQGIPALTLLTLVSAVFVPLHLGQQDRARAEAEREVLNTFGEAGLPDDSLVRASKREFSDAHWPPSEKGSDHHDAESVYREFASQEREFEFNEAGWEASGIGDETVDSETSHCENQYGPSSQRAGDLAAGDSREWFNVLNVSPGATEEEIKSAWRKAIAKVHPDRLAGMPREIVARAEEEAKELNAAYATAKLMVDRLRR